MTDTPVLPKGTYLERDGEHLVLKAHIEDGFITKDQFHTLREVVDAHPHVQLRLLTRQNFRLYHVRSEEADAMRERLEAAGFVATAPAGALCVNENAGLVPDEPFDIFPYLDALARWMNSRAAQDPNGVAFPGKIKLTLTSSETHPDNAAYADLAFLAKQKDGQPVFDILGGGSLGAQPRLAVLLKEAVPAEEMLRAANAMRSLFFEMFEGINVGKKRMRFQIRKMGEDAFLDAFQTHYEKAESEPLLLEVRPAVERPWAAEPKGEGEGLLPTSVAGIYSLRLPMVRGTLERPLMHLIDSYLGQLDHPVEMAVGSDQTLFIRDLSGLEAEGLLAAIEEAGLHLPKAHIVACVSADACKFGLARNEALAVYFAAQKDLDLPEIAISGCMNSCASHQMTPLGFWGKRMDRENPADVEGDLFELTIGGRRPVAGQEARLAENAGAMTIRQIKAFIPALVEAKKASGLDWQAFTETRGEEIRALVAQFNS